MRQTPVCSAWATLTTSVIVPRQFYLSPFLTNFQDSIEELKHQSSSRLPSVQKKTSWRTLGTSPPVRLASWSKLTHCWNWTYHPSSPYIWIYDNQNHQIHNHHQNQQRHYPAASKPSSHLQRRALLDPWLSGKLLSCICTNTSLSIWFWWWWKLKSWATRHLSSWYTN